MTQLECAQNIITICAVCRNLAGILGLQWTQIEKNPAQEDDDTFFDALKRYYNFAIEKRKRT